MFETDSGKDDQSARTRLLSQTMPEHGTRDDFICSDVRWYDRYDFALPAKVPATAAIAR
jgi:hypothetical protein